MGSSRFPFVAILDRSGPVEEIALTNASVVVAFDFALLDEIWLINLDKTNLRRYDSLLYETARIVRILEYLA